MTRPLTRPDPSKHPAGDTGRGWGRGIPLGRFAGIEISAHWSVLLTWFLFADMLAVSVLPAARPGQSSAASWLAGTVTALAFFSFLLAHELAHSVTARHYGIRVRSITLWLFGGVSELESEPATPRADALIAAAGPATSLLLGTLAYAAAAWLGSGLAAVSLAWLGVVNVLLAVFNLLPGAPLDGGRLLRAGLWWHYQDRARGAAAATRAGRGLGIGLAILGGLQVLAGYLSGLWLVLIGWFVISAAAGEQAASRTESLRGLRASQLMLPVVLAVPDWWTVEQFLARLSAEAAGQPAFPLVDFAGRLTGVLTLPELAKVPVTQRDERRLRELTAGRQPQPLVVAPDADLAEMARLLPLHGGLAVVTADGHPVGLITGAEVARAAQLAGLNWHTTAGR